LYRPTTRPSTPPSPSERDADGRIVRELQEVGGEAHFVEVSYDPEGNKLGRRTSLGHTEQVERDALGARVRTLLDGGIWLGHASDPLGRETSRLLPAGGRIETGFDPLGRVARRRAWHRTAAAGLPPGQPDWVGGGASPRGVTVDTAYRYSPDGELCEALDAARGRTAFKYDPVGQLLEMVPAQARGELFRFDPRGNLHEAEPGAPQRVYGPGNRLLQKGATRYRWDDDGRLVEKRTPKPNGEPDEVWRYAWNAAGLLAEVERPDGMRVRFAYDPFARRVEKELLRPAPGARLERVTHTRFVWDGDVLAHELTERAEAAGDPVVEQRTYLYEDDSFEPVAHAEPGGRWVHYVNDQIGTPERLLEGNGEVACELRRTAWGQTELQPGARATTPIRFQGQYEDAETGLAYNRWRYYDKEAGRFVSADPIGLVGSINEFAGGANPLGWVDPYGLLIVVDPQGQAVVVGTYNELNRRGVSDAHHVVQNAAVRELPGYSRGRAPCVGLPGPSTDPTTPHGAATSAQRQCDGPRGTLGAELSVADQALRAAGLSAANSATVTELAERSFAEQGHDRSTTTRVPGRRRGARS